MLHGFEQWVDDYRKARRFGNVKLAKQIKANIDAVIKTMKLDAVKVYGSKLEGGK